MRKEEADRLAVVSATASLGKSRADVDGLDLIAELLLLGVGHGVGNDQPAEAAAVQVLNGLARQNAMHDNGVDFPGAVLHDGVGGLDECTAGVGHVVDDNSDLVLNVADEDHA